MFGGIFSKLALIMLLMSVWFSAFNIQSARADGTICIRADGSIDPPDAPVSTVDNMTYTFTNDIFDEIVVAKNSIVIDGSGHTLHGTGTGQWTSGFDLSVVHDVTIKNTHITNFLFGIYIYYSEYSDYSGYFAAARTIPTSNIIANNTITDCSCAISIFMWDSTWTSHNHQIIGNTIRNNTYGVGLWGNTRNNHVYHNTFSNNTCQAVVDTGLQTNYWNGNYWSDYAGTDADHDGIGDTPYTIDAYNTDHYPLMKPYLPAPSISFSPHEIYLDEQTRNFTVSVNIENLQASHKLGIVSVRLEYNSALISLVSDVRGDFLKDFDRLFLIETSFPYILLVNTNKTITDFPEGNGTIWVCSFEVRALVETTIRLISEAADVEGNVLIQNSSNYCHLIVAQAFDEWVPWVPNPDQLELHYWQRGSTSYVNVSVHAESMAYEVSSWGIPAIDGSNIAANAEAWHWTGYIVLIYDPRTYNHTYDLGNLPTGDYVFNFRVWGHLVEKITFSVVHTVPRLGIDPYYCYVRDGYATFNITIEGIKESDHLVAIQFRLRWYDPSVLAPSEATEGPFMQDSRWNLYGTYFFVSEDEVCDYCGFRILIGDLLLPKQQDGNWTVFPYGGGVFATVRFQAFSNVTSLGHIWTRVDLQSAYAFSNLMEDIDLSPSGVWVCLLEEAAADVVMDGQVDMWDLATVAKHFGCSLGDSRWMFRADVNGDGRIDMKDLGFVANQWGNNFEVPQLAY